eukprot:6100183-Pyramimonas_sp.AAC.1
MESLGVLALNTFRDQCVEVDGTIDHSRLWTRGVRNRPDTRTHIDFLCVTIGIHGYARARSVQGRLFTRSDHRPVVGCLELPPPPEGGRVKQRTLLGWRPETDEALTQFKRSCTQLAGHDLNVLQETLLHLGCDTPRATFFSRKRQQSRITNDPVKKAKALLANATEADRPSLVRSFRKLCRRARQERNERRLSSISSSRQSGQMPVTLTINGERTADRERWRHAAKVFGTTRFQDDENTLHVQEMRLGRWASRASNEILDGRRPPTLSAFSVLQGRARMKAGTAAGKDGAPPELYKALPFTAIVRFWRVFQRRYLGKEVHIPATWKQIDFSGLKKIVRPLTLSHFRLV